jgi:hypothetical protein
LWLLVVVEVVFLVEEMLVAVVVLVGLELLLDFL